VRCGTNFLLIVMVVAVFVYSFIPRPNSGSSIGSRIVLVPLIAGLSYEVIRLAAKNMQRGLGAQAHAAGSPAPELTTREPELDQLEVAIASLRAVFTAEQRTEVDARAGPARTLRSRPRSDPRSRWPSCRSRGPRASCSPITRSSSRSSRAAVRCHGGFAADGSYVSPRTKNRVPAIDAWQQSHREQFGTEILEAPIELWPEVSRAWPRRSTSSGRA
jgi:hypothetical protein